MADPQPFGYPSFRTVSICVPWSGRPLPPELPLAFKTCSPPMNTNGVYFEIKGQPIDKARNMFAERSIECGAKYIFFWDEDVLVPAQALRELMFVMDNWDDVGIVAGIYCLKVDRPEPLVFMDSPGCGPYWDWKVGEIFECAAVGMGCTLIRTEMLKDIEKPWFRTVDDYSAYLDNLPYAEQWTEDIWFCERVRKTKWKIIANGQIICPHIDVRTGRRYELPPDSKPMRNAIMFKTGQKRILDVGSGTQPYKTDDGKVVTVDIRGDVGADYRCDFRKLPFATASFDVVHSSHSLEHIARDQQDTTLDEWIRVLKPDGELRLTLPNIEWAAKRIIEGDFSMLKGTDVNCLDVLYGQQKYPEDFHKGGFTPRYLTDLLKRKGFKRFDIQTPMYHVICNASRTAAPKLVKQKNGKPHAKVSHLRRSAA